jgi:hypothetical protein
LKLAKNGAIARGRRVAPNPLVLLAMVHA